MKEYAVIVRTDSYAGNFERELCAHLTGQIGECEKGKEYIDPSIKTIFDSYVTRKPDDHGCWRPVSLGGCTLTAGYSGQDVVIWFSSRPTEAQMNLIRERSLTFDEAYSEHSSWYKPSQPIKIEGIDAVSIEVVVNIEKLEL